MNANKLVSSLFAIDSHAPSASPRYSVPPVSSLSPHMATAIFLAWRDGCKSVSAKNVEVE